ncbi:MAG: hypothetical protein H0X36_11375 [Sphingomonadaceae bacterium]|nr:hypothetical protein [Sphingomonadaceae bacterium]
MRGFFALLVCVAPIMALAQSKTETWVLTTHLWGNPVYQTLSLTSDGTKLGGDLDGDALIGRRTGRTIEFTATTSDKATYSYRGVIDNDEISGTADLPDTNDSRARAMHPFTARRIAERPPGPPRRYDFTPADYSNAFSPHRLPVLTIWPGDTVHTTTIDSGGVDEKGITRALYGNPQTGPFFIATAAPGDTLVIRIGRLRLNRDYADSLDTIVGPALSASLAGKADDLGKPVRWKLDRERGLASPETSLGRSKSLNGK